MTVSELDADVAYILYLRAVNRVGHGPSVKFRIRTPKRAANEQSGASTARP